MNTREAKDFLVQQTAEQAALEGVPLSDLEKRMMYFTETGDCPEDPIALNDAFEAEYDTAEYESEIGKLMRHACWRLKKENPGFASQWKNALRQISKEDHYLTVLWNAGYTERPPHDALKLFGTALAVTVLGVVVIGIAVYIFGSLRHPLAWRIEPCTCDTQVYTSLDATNGAWPRLRRICLLRSASLDYEAAFAQSVETFSETTCPQIYD